MNADTPPPTLLNPWQRRVIGTALTTLAVIILLASLVLGVLLMQQVVTFFSHLLMPLAVAFMLTMLLRPVVELLQKRLNLKRPIAIALLFLLLLIIGGALLGAIGLVAVNQLLELIRYLPELIKSLQEVVAKRLPQVSAYFGGADADAVKQLLGGLENTLRDMSKLSWPALRTAGSKLIGFGSLVAAFAVVPIYVYYLLMSDRNLTRDLGEQFTFLNDELRKDGIFLIDQFASIMVSFFQGQIIIALIMGVLLAIGFTAIGLEFGLVLGLLIGMLNIIPYLGTIIGLGTALPLAYFQHEGGLITMILALAVFIVVQLVESYFLTPRIMGKRTGLHPMVIIVSIFFWGIALNGILGMILAIPLTAFFVVFWRLLKQKYFVRNTAGQEA